MTQDEVANALHAYEQELDSILRRFTRNRDGIHIQLDDDARFRQIGLEVLNLLRDEFLDGPKQTQQLAHILNDGVGWTGTASHHGVESLKSFVRATHTRVKRSPAVLKSQMSASHVHSDETLSVLEKLGVRLHLIARQLRERHAQRPTIHINDEYDLQDLSHALLRLFFDDVRREEWSPSYAGGASRMDFLLPADSIVVEFKMMRPSLSAKHLGEQLVIDIAKYKVHPGCGSLFCIVYDPDQSIANPRGIERDLTKSHDGLPVRVLIVPR